MLLKPNLLNEGGRKKLYEVQKKKVRKVWEKRRNTNKIQKNDLSRPCVTR